MKAGLVGRLAHRALRSGGKGRVVGVFRHAACLELPGGPVVVGDPWSEASPLCLRLDAPLPAIPSGAAARADSRTLRLAGVEVDWGTATRWLGGLPPAGALADAEGWLTRSVGPFAATSPLLRPPYRERTVEFLSQLGGGRLDVARVAGLGPGLTPAGDDLLAGVVFWLRASGGTALGPVLARIARSAITSSLSSMFLEGAAYGEWLDPAHALLAALARRSPQATARSAARLAEVGGSSGRDFCLGLRAAAMHATNLRCALAGGVSRRAGPVVAR